MNRVKTFSYWFVSAAVGMRLTKFIVTITSFCLYERYLSIFGVCLFNQTDYR